MKWQAMCYTLLLFGSTTVPGQAADPRYPDWPCAQAKVPEVSLAAVWAGPPLDEAMKQWKNSPKISAAIPRLAARRTPIEEAEQTITDLVNAPGADKTQTGKLLFAGLFETLNNQRSTVMNGLERITRKQREAAKKVRADTLELQTNQGAATPDPAKIEELGNRLIWETRIFEDRNRVIKFVCEVPTAIDQRMFALGRIIQQAID